MYILAIDQGTTGSRALVFDGKGKVKGQAYTEFRQYYPKPGWVEHDAEEIWDSCVKVINAALKKAGITSDRIISIGITNQRETTVLWDRETSKPAAKAVVWQCRRSAGICNGLKEEGYEPVFRRKTGLVLDPYFSGTKIRWLLDNVRGLKKRAENGRICFGTVDSWLIWKLTGGVSHVTDYSNASRTLMFNIRKLAWDRELLSILNIPEALLPEALPSGGVFGTTAKGAAGLKSGIPVTAVLGDQQAALYGQGCFKAGTIKNTYGTGCFMVLNTGKKRVFSTKGLLTTVAADSKGRPVYALEGSVFIAGAAIQWLRDELRVIPSSPDSEKAALKVPDTNGVYFVPAFAGLGAPYWDSEARGLISGLTRGSNVNHIIRAALESIAYQTRDIFDIMKAESGYPIRLLKVDGGASQNSFLMQFQSDILNCRILRPQSVESTAQGAALLSGVVSGVYGSASDLAALDEKKTEYRPKMKKKTRDELYDGWIKAVGRTRSSDQ